MVIYVERTKIEKEDVYMYRHYIQGKKTFVNQIEGYGAPIQTYFSTEDGETPMSLLNAALGSCMLMCVQGYLKSQGYEDKLVEMAIQYEAPDFHATIMLPEALSKIDQAALLSYIDRQCRVKKLLKYEIVVNLTIQYKSDGESIQ